MSLRVSRQARQSGFTLVELMIVVAIVAILAVLGTFGARKYLAQAKAAEATNTVGAINRAAVAAYLHETGPNQIVIGGAKIVSAPHVLCTSSASVPATDAAIQGRKYTANTANNADYHATTSGGWACLKFEMSEPQSYRYKYTKGAAPGLAANVTVPAGADWLAEARGDLNGDGTFSGFVTGGKIANSQPTMFTEIAQQSPEE